MAVGLRGGLFDSIQLGTVSTIGNDVLYLRDLSGITWETTESDVEIFNYTAKISGPIKIAVNFTTYNGGYTGIYFSLYVNGALYAVNDDRSAGDVTKYFDVNVNRGDNVVMYCRRGTYEEYNYNVTRTVVYCNFL